MGKLSRLLYNISRAAGKTASTMNDIETLLSGNPKKIAKRAVRKTINGAAYKGLRKINKLF